MAKTRSVSNWGKWGKTDRRGALNYLTPEVVARASAVVKKGKVYHLGLPIDKHLPLSKSQNPPFYKATKSPRGTPDGLTATTDLIAFELHGTGTHMDGLGHYFYGDQFYNGFPASAFTNSGSADVGLERVGAIVARGVLLDLRAKVGDLAMPGHPITAAEMQVCAKAEGVEIRQGDVLLLYTGWLEAYLAGKATMEHQPGPSASSVPWLRQKGIVAVGGDFNTMDVRPYEDPKQPAAFHKYFIRDVGGYAFEDVVLHELARDRAYECLFVVAPLLVTGATGGPVNPVAVV